MRRKRPVLFKCQFPLQCRREERLFKMQGFGFVQNQIWMGSTDSLYYAQHQFRPRTPSPFLQNSLHIITWNLYFQFIPLLLIAHKLYSYSKLIIRNASWINFPSLKTDCLVLWFNSSKSFYRLKRCIESISRYVYSLLGRLKALFRHRLYTLPHPKTAHAWPCNKIVHS